MHITPASVYDVNELDFINYEPSSYYIMNRGYIDVNRMATIDKHDSYFVMKSKTNLSFIRISADKPENKNGILCDQRIKLKGTVSFEKYEKEFRNVKFYDAEQKKSFVFLSKNLTLPATEIALLYKNR